jgi:hypothetical protein
VQTSAGWAIVDSVQVYASSVNLLGTYGQYSYSGDNPVVSMGTLQPVPFNLPAGSPAIPIRTAVATGNWSNAATWSNGVIPNPGDNIIISSGIGVTVDVNTDLSTFGTLSIFGNGFLTVAFGVTVAQLSAGWILGINYGTINIVSGVVVNNNPGATIGTVKNMGKVHLNAATITTNAGNVDCNLSGATITTNNGVVGVNQGIITTNLANAANGPGTVQYNAGTVSTNSGIVYQGLGGTVTTNTGTVVTMPVTDASVQADVAAAITAAGLATAANQALQATLANQTSQGTAALATSAQAAAIKAQTDLIATNAADSPNAVAAQTEAAAAAGAAPAAVWAYTTRTLTGTGGALGPTAGANLAPIPFGPVVPGQTLDLSALVSYSGAYATVAGTSAITYTIFDCEGVAVPGFSEVALTPSAVLFDTIQTDAEAANYNFRFRPSLSLGQPFPHAGHYLIAVTFTVSGVQYFANFRGKARYGA